MSFLYPSFLWALLAVAIPIIIHFFNFRTHKTVYFSNVAFLQNIDQENKSRNRLKDLLILLFRVLAIASLVIAFANPVKQKNFVSAGNDCENHYGIYVDNSFSMNASNSQGKSIDLAKSNASDIISALKQNSKYFYLTNEINPEQLHLYIKDITLNFVSTTSTSSRARKLSFVFDKFRNLFNSEESGCKHKIFIISDFQKINFDRENFSQDSNLNVVLLPIEPIETSNLYIDSIWFESPYHLLNSADSLTVRISNSATQAFTNQQIELYINDTLKTLSNFNIEANTSVDFKLKFSNTTKGFISGRISIEDYPIDYDNSMFFNYYIAPKVEVLMISGETNFYLQKFYNDNQYFNLTEVNISNISISQFGNYQSIILSSVSKLSSGVIGELKNYVSSGGIVVLIPSVNSQLADLNQFMDYFQLPEFTNKNNDKLIVNNINLRDKIYSDAFEEINPASELPEIYSHFKINKNILSDYESILIAENDDRILIYKEIEEGFVYVFTSDMLQGSTNFMTNPVSIPTFYNIPVFAKNRNKIYYVIGSENTVELKNIKNQEGLKLKNIETGFEFIPVMSKISQNKIKINFENVELIAGNYIILDVDNQVGLISFNYDRKESDLSHYTTEELQEYIDNNGLNWEITTKTGDFLQNEIISGQKSNSLWKIFVILALIFLLAEILTIRLIKS
ncbi:MAG: BatA domain-containing protein [Bacteroidales bacterium]|nr:BatA domain-containing protein [Bacteroidales bacterium]